MFKAFSHICKKVKLSLYKNTLTIYPRRSSSINSNNPLFKNIKVYVKKNTSLERVNNIDMSDIEQFCIEHSDELGICRYGRSYDPDHDLYHQDGFNQEETHSHLQFYKDLDQSNLELALIGLEMHDFISEEERKSVMQAWAKANILRIDFASVKNHTSDCFFDCYQAVSDENTSLDKQENTIKVTKNELL